jgi:hypothetical protein
MWDGVVMTGLVWLRIGTVGALVNSVLNLQVPSNAGKIFVV